MLEVKESERRRGDGMGSVMGRDGEEGGVWKRRERRKGNEESVGYGDVDRM